MFILGYFSLKFVVDKCVVVLLYCSYDNDGTSKDEIKERFSQTMEFVENYLRDVVCQSFPFADKEKNKLTFEVSQTQSVYTLTHIIESTCRTSV